MTNRSIKFRGAALSDLDGIADYSFKAFGAHALRRYLDELQRCFFIISKHPEIGIAFIPKVRRFAVGQHWIYYSYSQKSVLIIRILPQKTVQKLRESPIVYKPQLKEHSENDQKHVATTAPQATLAPAPHPVQSAPSALQVFQTFAPHE